MLDLSICGTNSVTVSPLFLVPFCAGCFSLRRLLQLVAAMLSSLLNRAWLWIRWVCLVVCHIVAIGLLDLLMRILALITDFIEIAGANGFITIVLAVLYQVGFRLWLCRHHLFY